MILDGLINIEQHVYVAKFPVVIDYTPIIREQNNPSFEKWMYDIEFTDW